MKALFKHYLPFIKVLAIPYIFIMFILVYPINFYLNSPGGLTEVKSLIEVDYNLDKDIEGTISSTYIVSIKKPTFFQFMLGTFTDYSTSYEIPESQSHYTTSETATINYLDKEISVDSAIIVAYMKAEEANTEIQIDYIQKTMVFGKAEYLDYYDDIAFGDEFVQAIGDNDYVITDSNELGSYTLLSDSYDFTFMNEAGETYTLTLSKDDEYDKFGITLKKYYIVDQSTVFPKYKENNSNIGGPSGGLLQTLSIYNVLIDEDLTNGLKIAGTGTINYDGSVGYIGGVEQKIITAYLNKVDIFFIPSVDDTYYYDNYQEALRVCDSYGLDPTGWLIPVASFDEALTYLKGLN